MRLFALSDLHVAQPPNRRAIEASAAHPDDWLIVAGDVCETEVQLAETLDVLTSKWARVLWVPGNHELWTLPSRGSASRGVDRYLEMCDVCRARGVLTPEDPYVDWPGDGPPTKIALLFLLYDYSFAPVGMTSSEALAWALEDGISAVDEQLLHFDPYPSREAWCHARCDEAEARLGEASRTHELVLVNHWPLRRDLVRIPRVPRFSPWCGTRRTEDWHTRFRARVVVSGHLHVRRTDYRDGVRFEEVSLGYVRDWDQRRGLDAYLRAIL